MTTAFGDGKKWHRTATVRANEDRFHIMVDAIKDGIFITDAVNGRFIDANRAGLAMLGFSMDELIGCTIGSISSGIYPYTQEIALKTAAKAKADGLKIIPSFEWQCRTKDGQLFWTEISTSYAEIDGVPAIIAILRDISERKRMNQQLNLALTKAADASKAKSAFLAGMSHELRTPLNAIIGFSDLMLNQILGPLGHPRYREYIGDIHTSGQHLLALINDVLDLSRLEAGKTVLLEELVSLGTIAGEACRMLSTELAQAKIKIVTRIPTGLSDIFGDERRIKQIILNLMSNAIKFTPSGGTITICAGQDNKGIHFSIRDTGIGIADEDLPKIFERFGQIDNSLSRKFEGSGLGLPLVQQLVELHGGTVVVESEVDAGTLVTVTFPPRRIAGPANSAAA